MGTSPPILLSQSLALLVLRPMTNNLLESLSTNLWQKAYQNLPQWAVVVGLLLLLEELQMQVLLHQLLKKRRRKKNLRRRKMMTWDSVSSTNGHSSCLLEFNHRSFR